MLKKLYARFILFLIEPALELDLKSIRPEKIVPIKSKIKKKKKFESITDLQLDLLMHRKEETPQLSKPDKFVNLPLNDRLRLVREYKKLSQAKLGEYCGLDQSQVSAYERGKKKLTVEDMITFSKALNVDIDYFLGKVNDFRKF